MRRPGTTLIFAALLVFCIQLIPAASIAQDEEQTPNYVPGQLIIGFQPWVTQEEIDNFYEQYGIVEMDDLNRDPESDREVKLAFVPVDVSQDLIDTIERDPRVRYAEPNFIVQVNKEPDDPDWEKLWGLNNTGQTGGAVDADIDALEGWAVETGSSDVIIAVVDTGVDYTHEDLVDNMWVNPGECPKPSSCEKDGEDDDDNGYVDDFYGINAITDSGDPMDDFGHGTHVAGTIGAVGDNGVGVVGVNWKARIVACKFLSASGGGTSAGAIKCFNYINHLKNEQGQNIIAVNNSWGGGGASEAMKDAMEGADQPLHVCAAGNNNSDTPHYPAAFDLENIISVAATDDSDTYAGFSNYGDTVDLAAPGVEILSTVPTGSCALCDPSGYTLMGGTSMAAPHVAGTAGLIAAKYSSLTPVQIRQRMLTGVDPLSDASKTTVTNGRLNTLNTLEEDEIPPAAVGDLAVSQSLLTQVELSWTATGDDGMNGTATSYDVRYAQKPISADNWDNATRALGAAKPQEAGSPEEFTVTGLDPDTTYYLALKVLDNVGNESDLSNVVIGKTSAGTIVFEDDMEDGEGDWTTAGSDSLWHLSEKRSNSPTHAWYYGDESKGNYDTGGATSGFLISPPIDLTTNKDVLLVYYEWSELENSTTYDRTRVQISVDEASSWETVFESHGTQDNWMRRTISLTPYVGEAKTIQIRFWFDSIDNRFNAFEGWYVDDVQVLVAAPGLPGEGPSLPNLFMQDANIGLSVPEPVEGTPVEVSAIVINNGFAEANDVKIQFMDLSGDSPVPLGAPQTVANIPAGGSGTAKITYETDGKVGTRTLQAVADPFNLITELNEADNQAQRSMTVVAQPAPNLLVKSGNVGFNPSGPQPGEQVTISAVVVNDGAVQASTVVVQVVDTTDSGVSEPIGDPKIIDVLAPGESSTVVVTYDTSGKSGARKITVSADPQNAIAESDEDDNSATATLEMTSPPLPNLVVSSSSVGFDPVEPVSGDTVTIMATVRNEGDVEARGVMVLFTDETNSGAQSAAGSTVIGEPQTIAVIPPGASGVTEVTYSTGGRSGDRKIQVSVDPHNFIAESKQFDNEAKVTLSVTPAPAPNLAMSNSNIGFNPPVPVEGEKTTVSAVVLNDGNASASAITVQFLDVSDGGMIPVGEKQTIPHLAAGASSTAKVIYDTNDLVGERTIQVVVDPNNFVSESNEEDNDASATVTISTPPAPNLTMTAANILFDPAEPTLGDEVTITAAVLNTGAADASHVLVQFVDVTNGGFTPIGDEQIIEVVRTGKSATASVVYDSAPALAGGKASKRKIQILVDSNNLIAESNESDNEAVTTLVVVASPIPNLVVTKSSIGFNPLHPVVGDEVKVTASVQNQGDADADDVVVQLLDVSEGESIPVGEPQQVARINAGGAVMVEMTYPVSGKPGDRQLRFVVDPGNFIPESDETDNRATAVLLVSAESLPNLVVQTANIGFSPADPVDSDLVTVTVTILNNGADDAADVLVQFVDATGGGAEPIAAKQTITRISAGTSETTQVVYDTAGKSGERRIRVEADPHMVIVESSEIDNEAIGLLVVRPKAQPNLVAKKDNIGFSTTQPAPGEIVTVTATILNDGATSAENVVVQFVDATGSGSTPIGASQVISSVPVGGSGVAQIRYNTAGRFGERKVQVVVDPNNLIAESDKNDNRAVGTIVVESPPVANLVMTPSAIGFNPSEPNADDTVEIYATVRNDGTAAASEIVVNFLDITAGGAVPIGEAQTINTIAAGSSAVVQVTYSIPATGGAAAGDRKIQVVLDPNNTVTESKESDNEATATLSLAKAPLANLTVLSDNITFSNPAPVQGENVTVRAVILNTGDTDVTDVVVQFSDVSAAMGMTPIGPPQVIPGILAGGSATAEIVYDTSGKSGDRSIQVTADPSNFIPESKETDNTSKGTLTISLPATPDLVVLAGNIGFNPAIPTEGEAVSVNAVVLNHGANEAHGVVVQFMDVTDGASVPIETPQTIVRIPAGAGASVQVTYDTAPVVAGGEQGERTIQVIADPNNFIVESDESNNKAIKSLTVAPPPAPNLVALSSNVEFDPPKPTDGDLVTILATVLNDGTATATDVVVRLADMTDGAPQLIGKQRLVDTILPGESATVQVSYDVTDKQGDRKIQFSVDPNNTIAETDENDNVALVTLTVAPPPTPNLVVKESNIKFSPASPMEGSEVTVSVTVLNDGPMDANMVEAAFADVTNGNGNGTPIGSTQTIANIPSGGSGAAQVTYDTTGKVGDRKIQVTADPNSLIAETDETDNQAEEALTVLPAEEEKPELPNLVVTSSDITFDPSAPTAGDIVTVTVVVTNSGDGDASNVVVRFSDKTGDSSEQIGTDQTIASIASGKSGTASVTYDTAEKTGERTIHVSVDPDNAIAESDETDNEATATLSVAATLAQGSRPNLVVRTGDVQVDLIRPQEGDVLTVAAIVHNNGSMDVEGVRVQFRDVTEAGPLPIGELHMVDYIPAGGSARIEALYDTNGKAGPYTVEFAIDPEDMIRELDESDNAASTSIEVLAVTR